MSRFEREHGFQLAEFKAAPIGDGEPTGDPVEFESEAAAIRYADAIGELHGIEVVTD